MPIKFRCEYCQQLLGISRSRAAATVDCPQCGRSLKVPGSKGQDLVSDSPAETTHDEDLMSALNELTMLGMGNDGDRPVSSQFSAGIRAFDDSSVIMEGKDVPEERARQRDFTGRSPEPAPTDGRDNPSVDSNEALQDLAAWAGNEPVAVKSGLPAATISTDLLTEMRQASYPASWLATAIAAVLLIAISGAAGWWLARSGTLDSWISKPSDGGGSTDAASPDETEAEAHIPAGIVADPKQWVISAAGQARYVDQSGQNRADGKASIYLLPATREGNLKVHARSFQRAPADADRRFSEAALQALGGMRVEADSEGRFEIGTAARSDSYQLIVVSRNHERPDNVLADSDITNTLMPWFDSTVHILGQRSAIMETLSRSDADIIMTTGE